MFAVDSGLLPASTHSAVRWVTNVCYRRGSSGRLHGFRAVVRCGYDLESSELTPSSVLLDLEYFRDLPPPCPSCERRRWRVAAWSSGQRRCGVPGMPGRMQDCQSDCRGPGSRGRAAASTAGRLAVQRRRGHQPAHAGERRRRRRDHQQCLPGRRLGQRSSGRGVRRPQILASHRPAEFCSHLLADGQQQGQQRCAAHANQRVLHPGAQQLRSPLPRGSGRVRDPRRSALRHRHRDRGSLRRADHRQGAGRKEHDREDGAAGSRLLVLGRRLCSPLASGALLHAGYPSERGHQYFWPQTRRRALWPG